MLKSADDTVRAHKGHPGYKEPTQKITVNQDNVLLFESLFHKASNYGDGFVPEAVASTCPRCSAAALFKLIAQVPAQISESNLASPHVWTLNPDLEICVPVYLLAGEQANESHRYHCKGNKKRGRPSSGDEPAPVHVHSALHELCQQASSGKTPGYAKMFQSLTEGCTRQSKQKDMIIVKECATIPMERVIVQLKVGRRDHFFMCLLLCQ